MNVCIYLTAQIANTISITIYRLPFNTIMKIPIHDSLIFVFLSKVNKNDDDLQYQLIYFF